MDNKEKLMNKIAVYAQAKEPAMQLLTKIAACSKSKGKRQAIRKMTMPKTASERIRALYKLAGDPATGEEQRQMEIFGARPEGYIPHDQDTKGENADQQTPPPSAADVVKYNMRHPLAYLKDNPEQAIATGAGALGMGAGAYLLAKLLKRKRAWMYGLGGALAGGAAGALGGQAAYAGGKKAYAAIKQWLDEKRSARIQARAEAASKEPLENANPNPGSKFGRPEMFN